jgi:AGCS family alanine or glycine:cation symporter
MASGIAPSPDLDGAEYVQLAIKETLGAFGPIFITVAMVLFAFTTLLGNLFYVDKAFRHLLGRTPGKVFQGVYYIIASGVIFLGAGLSADILWGVADIAMGCMTLINMPVILYLSPIVIRALKDFTRQRKEGKDPVFKAKDIDLPHAVDYWQ